MAEAAQQLPSEVEYELSQMELESYSYAKGRKDGIRQACTALLAQRGVELDWAQRARLDRCQDLEQLTVWLVRAATATSADDLFDDHA